MHSLHTPELQVSGIFRSVHSSTPCTQPVSILLYVCRQAVGSGIILHSASFFAEDVDSSLVYLRVIVLIILSRPTHTRLNGSWTKPKR